MGEVTKMAKVLCAIALVLLCSLSVTHGEDRFYVPMVNGGNIAHIVEYSISSFSPVSLSSTARWSLGTSARVFCVAYSEQDDLIYYVLADGNTYSLDRGTGTTQFVTDRTNNFYVGRTIGDCAINQKDNQLITVNAANAGVTTMKVLSLDTLNAFEYDPLYRGYGTDPYGGSFTDPGVAIGNGAMYAFQGDNVLLMQDDSGYVGVSDFNQGVGAPVVSIAEYRSAAGQWWAGNNINALQVFNDPLLVNGSPGSFSSISSVTMNSLGGFSFQIAQASFTFAPVAIPTITAIVPHQCCASFQIEFDEPVVPSAINSALTLTSGSLAVQALSDTLVEVTAVEGATPGVPYTLGLDLDADFSVRSESGSATPQTFNELVRPLISLPSNPVPSGTEVTLSAYLRAAVGMNLPTVLGTNWGATFEWDLDGDGVYGETGPAANFGDEVGPVVQLDTRGRNLQGMNNGVNQVCVRITSGCLCSPENQCVNINVRNQRPTADIGGPYTTIGSSVNVTMTGTDPSRADELALQYEWDLDGDFVFGETGPAATNGDENVANAIFTSTVVVPTREFIIRGRTFDGQLYSRVQQTIVTIPGLSATRECPCPFTALPELSSLDVFESAVFDPQDPYSILLTQSNAILDGPTSGAVFRTNPLTFNIETDGGFELCAVIQASNLQTLTSGYVAGAGDGGISFVITSDPTETTAATGANAGLVGRPQSTGVSLLFRDTIRVDYGNTNGFESFSQRGGYPADDAHEHHLQIRYRASTRTLETFVDGISVELRQFDLFDEAVLGQTGPEFEVYYGFAASTSANLAQDIRVDSDYSLCKYSDFPPI